MGHQCYYVGIREDKLKNFEKKVKELIKTEPYVHYREKIKFKKEIPANFSWQYSNYNETFQPKKDVLYLIIYGDRYNVNRVLDQLPERDDIVPLDVLDTTCYLTGYDKEANETFENNYVKIF